MESGKLNAFFIHTPVLRLWVLDVIPTIARNAVILVERSSSGRGDVREWVGMWGKWKENRRNAKEKHHVYWRLCTFVHCTALLCAQDAWMTHSVYTNVGGVVNATLCMSIGMDVVVLHALAVFVVCWGCCGCVVRPEGVVFLVIWNHSRRWSLAMPVDVH